MMHLLDLKFIQQQFKIKKNKKQKNPKNLVALVFEGYFACEVYLAFL